MKKVAIIGAGIAGLTVANLLKDDTEITIFEKSRGVSGRVSTRRAEPYFFDHGAQFIKATNPDFTAFITPMIEAGVIKRWDARFAEIDRNQIIATRQWDHDNPHYVGVPSMNAIGKYLSQGLNIALSTKVEQLSKQGDKWFLYDQGKQLLGKFDWVILAIPPQQALSLLPVSLLEHAKLQSQTMQACFALMLGFNDPLPLTFDVALVHNQDISWISVNNTKPGREGAYSLLVHSTNKWADEHIEDNPTKVLQHLAQQVSYVIGHNALQAEHQAMHAWRYANLGKQSGETHLLNGNENIGLCGDWFIHGRVEAAFCSGYELAKNLRELLKQEQR